MNLKIYLQLAAISLIPIAASVLVYLLKHKTAFGKLSKVPQQIIIGILFGGVAIIGTEFGVSLDGATANIRDSAPLCAGLLFGGPAGIIAGIIGGIERVFSVIWKPASEYSVVACSVSTVFSGFFAAFLRKFVFDRKRPSIILAFATGVVTEVIHMTMLMLTHINDFDKAYGILRICTLPMIICNAVAVMLATVAIGLLSHNLHVDGKQRYKSVTQKIRAWLLITVVLAYLATTTFVYFLQTGTALESAKKIMTKNIEDIDADVEAAIDTKLLSVAHQVANVYDEDPDYDFSNIQMAFSDYEINIVNQDGIILQSSNRDYVGFDFKSGEQSMEFMVLTQGADEFVQKYQKNTYGDSYKKYVGVALYSGGFIQIGCNLHQLNDVMTEQTKDITKNRHIYQTGYMVIADGSKEIISNESSFADTDAKETGIEVIDEYEEGALFEAEIHNESCYCMYLINDDYGFYVIAVIPTDELFNAREVNTMVNSFMEVIVFAALYTLVYILINNMIVNNIRRVNEELGKIIEGRLDTVVNVRGSDEFDSLSNYINSTVTVLKTYIAEADARIDKELEFAKNIQHSALPSVFPAYPNIPEFDVYADMFTAKEVGGDFYDFYMVGDDELVFLIADVSGKGIPAAMFMMRAKTVLKNFAELSIPVNEIMTEANTHLCEGNDAGMFVTCWLGKLNVSTGHVTVANAGHNPPMLYRKETDRYDYLKLRPGLVLAGMDEVKYRIQEFDMQPGDRLFLYTDGVTEATDTQDKLYGEDRLEDFLNSHKEFSLTETVASLKKDIDEFVGERDQFDDITTLILEYRGKERVKKMTEKVFEATDDMLGAATEFVEGELEQVDCPMKTVMQISVALEEIFVNVAHYAYPKGETGDVKITFEYDGDAASISFADSGVEFNPLAKDDPDITLSAEERRIGGLGIFMVKKTMDDVKYRYEDGMNILTIVKRIGVK